MANNNVVNMFLRLAPFLLVCFFSLYSVFNRDARGVIYLAGLLFACFFTVMIGNFPAFQKFHKDDKSKLNNFPYHAYNLSCRLLEVNDSGPISHLPLGQTILAYTLMFIGYPIFKYNFANNDFTMNNVIVVLTFIAFIVSDFIGNLYNGCFKLSAMITSFILGSSVGALWGHMIDTTNDNLQMFFTPDFNKRSKFRSHNKKSQRCKPVQTKKIYQINETSDDISSFCLDGGDIIICDRGNNVILRVKYDKTYTNILSSSIIAGKITDNLVEDFQKDQIIKNKNAIIKLNDDQLHNPHTVCRDGAGNIYISDTERHVIRKVNKSDGKVTIFAGKLDVAKNSGDSGKAIHATLNRPTSMCIDNKNNLWVICENTDDKKTKCIRVISDKSNINTVYSDDGIVLSVQILPDTSTICADKTNTIYIHIGESNLVYYIRPQLLSDFSNIKITPQRFSTYALGYFAGSDGVLYNYDSVTTIKPSIVDYQTYTVLVDKTKVIIISSNESVKKVDAIGNNVFILSNDQIKIADISSWSTNNPINPTPTTIYGKNSIVKTFDSPEGICLSGDGNTLYIADRNNHIIRQIDVESDRIDIYAGVIGEYGSDNDHLDSPTDVCVGKDGTVHILDSGNNRIMKKNTQGKMEKITDVFFSSTDKDVDINYDVVPKRFCMDSLNQFYVIFDGKINITKIAKDGVPTYFYNSFTSTTPASPLTDICTDSSNNLYITDSTLQKIYKLNWNVTTHKATNDISTIDMLSGITGMFIDTNYDIYLTNNSKVTNNSKAQYVNTKYINNNGIKSLQDDIIVNVNNTIPTPKAYNIVDGNNGNFLKNTKQKTAKSISLNGDASICKNMKYIFIADKVGNFIGKIYTNKAGI
jgi:sugar lactone lactonase YvrE